MRRHLEPKFLTPLYTLSLQINDKNERDFNIILINDFNYCCNVRRKEEKFLQELLCCCFNSNYLDSDSWRVVHQNMCANKIIIILRCKNSWWKFRVLRQVFCIVFFLWKLRNMKRCKCAKMINKRLEYKI